MAIYEICPSNCYVNQACVPHQVLDETELPEGQNGEVLSATLYTLGQRVKIGNASYDFKSVSGVARFLEDFADVFEYKHQQWACEYMQNSGNPCYDEMSWSCFLHVFTSDLTL